jgi:hypothetical protein
VVRRQEKQVPKIVIENNVPIQKRKGAIRRMQVGESFLMPAKLKNPRGQAYVAAQYAGAKVATRLDNDSKRIRVWRIS